MKGQVVYCGNPACEALIVKKTDIHTFCSMKCRKAARGTNWRGLRKQALKRDGFACVSCDAQGCRLEAHHIIPVCVGGLNVLDNLTVLCVPCHKEVHRHWDAYYNKLRLRARINKAA